MVFNMRKNKILFIFKRCEYKNNKILALKNLSFLSITLFIIIIQSFKPIIKNELNEDNININFSKDISNRKKSTSIFKKFKEMRIKKSDFIDITKINASFYYYLIRNKKISFFSLIINKIYDTLIKSFEILLRIKRDNRVSINESCLCDFEIKYKKCYKSYTSKNI